MEAIAQKFEEMYKTHYSAMRNAAENIISDPDASHDIVQEVFLKLWHKKDEIGHILNQRAYLLRSVANASITHLQKNKSSVRFADLKVEAADTSEAHVSLKELELNIAAALDKLPAKCKAIFVLSRFEGVKNKEIALMLGLTLKTVENQVGIALKKMRDELRPLLGSEFIGLAIGAGLSLLFRFLSGIAGLSSFAFIFIH